MLVRTNSGAEFNLDTLFDTIRKSTTPSEVKEVLEFTGLIVDGIISKISGLNNEDKVQIKLEREKTAAEHVARQEAVVDIGITEVKKAMFSLRSQVQVVPQSDKRNDGMK